MSYFYRKKSRLGRLLQLAGVRRLSGSENNSGIKRAYFTDSTNSQYIPAQGDTYTINWKDSENNKTIKVNITVLKNTTAFHNFLESAQNSNWDKFAVTFMPDKNSIQYWDPFNDNKSDFVVNCPVTPYNFLFFYSMYEQQAKIILESKRRSRMLFADYVKYRNIYRNYNNRINMAEEIYMIVREQMADIAENNFTSSLMKCYKNQLINICNDENILLEECEEMIPENERVLLYEDCLNTLIDEKFSRIMEKHFNDIFLKTIDTIWERFNHLLNEERFTSMVNKRIAEDYDDYHIIFSNHTLDWYKIPSIAAPRAKKGSLADLIKQIKSFYISAMSTYHEKMRQVYDYYWPNFDFDNDIEIPTPEDEFLEGFSYWSNFNIDNDIEIPTPKGEFLEGFSYILIFEPEKDALGGASPYLNSHSPFPWFIIPYSQRKKIDCHYYDPKIVNGETFLYLVPIEYVIK